MFRALVVMLIASLCASAPSMVMAQEQGMDVVKKMKEVFEPIRPSIRTVDITTRTSDRDVAHWIAREAMKQFPDGKRMIMVLLEPNDVKGNAYIIWEPKDKPSVV